MPHAGPICLSPCRTRYASFVASWLRLCLLHFHAGFRAGTDIGSVAHPDRSSTERSMRDRCLFYYPHSNWRYTPPQTRELVWQVLCRGACSKLTHQRFELNFRGVIPVHWRAALCQGQRAGSEQTDLPLRRTAMLFRCRFSFPNSISISKQQCQVNAKVVESGEPYCPAPPSIALCLENWVRRDTVF